ncbi:PfaD family polyunsaturated fatty acid/polyketide biosynthesis protein [Nocardia sp. XZ_19_385]|uniref:PfaD family polyunsaturated fatty acid/polyketide biosynthesis protein n=1 Tax=Nocardia sp. XZ_19_385 TaxID=2769488 RepID=UPI002815D287|nr:PfaD family polyunsaturated fatty acid/polyketide biosynthesis protein [Nocardia sp. XZ_19_385]
MLTNNVSGTSTRPHWHSESGRPAFDARGIVAAIRDPRAELWVLIDGAGHPPGVGVNGELSLSDDGFEVTGWLPPVFPEQLGDRSFAATHGVRFAYVAGEMANGIATTELVAAMARGQMLSFFGAAGLSVPAVESALNELTSSVGSRPNWGVNLIHSPLEPGHEERLVDLFDKYNVAKVSASAFMDLTPALVRCAVAGLSTDPAGRPVRRRHIFAKVSRLEVAAKFMSPPPPAMLTELVARGAITEQQAQLAKNVPLATDVTVEADSGGHTDNRPLTVILPAVLGLRDEFTRRFGYTERIRVGAAGGLGCPAGVAAAFGCGADYVLTGTVNQRSVEAGLSDSAKTLLAEAELVDIVMAPAADMFEYGIKVQVLRRGTLFAARAALLYHAYTTYNDLRQLPAELRTKIERSILRASFEEAWEQTREFWMHRDPEQVARAEADPKHRMALVFRAYLGRSSRWAIAGDSSRVTDYQIWCGPAIGAFNHWIAETPLAEPGACTVVQIARNLLEGAAVVTRAQQLRSFGVPVPRTDLYVPRLLS